MTNRRSKGRGPRIREDEVDRMVALYLEGKSLKTIAREVGRHWQTVRRYTIRAIQEKEGKELRREALRSSLVQHFEDLGGAPQSLKALLVMPGVEREGRPQAWVRESPELRDRLLLQALRDSHASESPLWGWWDRWVETREAYDNALVALRNRLAREEAQLAGSPGVSLTEAVDVVLSKEAQFKAQGLSVYDMGKLRVCPHPEARDREQLRLGDPGIILAEGTDMERMRVEFLHLAKALVRWPDTRELAGLYAQLGELKPKIEEEVEVLSLRRAFPGRCRLCPV